MRHGTDCDISRVETVDVDGAPHIRLAGECDVSSAPVLQDHVHRLLGRGCSRVVFDLQDVTFLDSSILGIFLAARRELLARGEVVLLCRPGFVRKLLALLELDTLLRVCTPEEWRQHVGGVH